MSAAKNSHHRFAALGVAVFLLASMAVTPASAQAADSQEDYLPASLNPSAVGFYPIWENSGSVLPHKGLFLGSNGAAFGINNSFQVGTNPLQFVYRTPNANLKYRILNQGRWQLAGQIGIYHLLEAASRAFLSPNFSSRIDNPDFSITMLPATFAATYHFANWMQIHQSATALTVFGTGNVLTETTFGYSVVAELMANARHSVSVHAQHVGITRRDFSLIGVGYHYQNTWFDFRAGYFYRFRQAGTQTVPLLSLGFWL